jgi:two-component system, NarL family, response regulator NreC
MSEKTKIILADDHAILRAGLRLLINNQADMLVIGEASNGAEVLAQAEDLQPDLVLLDLNMPGIDGLAALPRLHKSLPGGKILILTMHDDAIYLREALQGGASGYVLKKAVDTELLMAIRAVMRGETYIHSAMTNKLLQDVLPAAVTAENTGNPWDVLSEREVEVLRHVALGYTNAEIADKLALSVKTVETYRARGMEKLNLQTRAQLVRSAMEQGLLD